MTWRMGMTLILGGAGGIGGALREAYERAGDRCITVDRRPRPDTISKEDYYKCDMTQEDKVDRLWQKMETHIPCGAVDRLVLSLGIQEKSPGRKNAARMWQVNYDALVNAYFHLKMAMRRLAPQAEIVIVSSDMIFADEGQVDTPVYRDTKIALTAYFMREAREDKNKRFRLAFPGPVRTPLFSAGKSAETLARIEQGPGIMDPQDCAHALINIAAATAGQVACIRLYKNNSTSIPLPEVQGCLARFPDLSR